MAAKASNPLLSESYKSIKGATFQLKNYSTARSAIFANGATEQEILAMVDNLNSLKNIISSKLTVSGLDDYAKIQENDPTYNATAEYTAVVAAIDASLDYVTANIPAPRTFSISALAPLKTLVDDLTATIE